MMYSSLIEKLRYNSEDGNLYWTENLNSRARKDKIAGGIEPDGYRRIKFQKRNYVAHKVVWYMHNKTVVIGQLDHINGNRLDNRIENLRPVTVRQNAQNRKRHRKGSLVGCHQQRAKSGNLIGWESTIYFKGKSNYLGYFQSEEEAHLCYLFAALFYGVVECI